jgi:1,4-dihydroxy-2-naphthoyl-CoA synthase
MGYEALAQKVCWESEDAKEGQTAFLEKRSPVFTGR